MDRTNKESNDSNQRLSHHPPVRRHLPDDAMLFLEPTPQLSTKDLKSPAAEQHEPFAKRRESFDEDEWHELEDIVDRKKSIYGSGNSKVSSPPSPEQNVKRSVLHDELSRSNPGAIAVFPSGISAPRLPFERHWSPYTGTR
jgi:hypothetical protein